ncbi:hypothetical protein [Actinophytocola sp.]|uniref:hypothetical protein n=1 Tax=Actinophytocola sp. TaxID=1872138 RepID=UPI002ED66507
MSLDVNMLQELNSTEEIGLADCPILGSCCGPLAPPPIVTTLFTCFGCTFTL